MGSAGVTVDPDGGDGVRPCVDDVGAESAIWTMALLGEGWSDLGVVSFCVDQHLLNCTTNKRRTSSSFIIFGVALPTPIPTPTPTGLGVVVLLAGL